MSRCDPGRCLVMRVLSVAVQTDQGQQIATDSLADVVERTAGAPRYQATCVASEQAGRFAKLSDALRRLSMKQPRVGRHDTGHADAGGSAL